MTARLFAILDRWDYHVIYSGEAVSRRALIRAALAARADLTGADTTGADLTRADLTRLLAGVPIVRDLDIRMSRPDDHYGATDRPRPAEPAHEVRAAQRERDAPPACLAGGVATAGDVDDVAEHVDGCAYFTSFAADAESMCDCTRRGAP